jgi:hypothetical protein
LSLRIVVTGFVGTFPLGGVFWDYLQYVLGFLQLGHDVMYIEDTGKWCYNPNSRPLLNPEPAALPIWRANFRGSAPN